ncbi:MAG: SIS domain-containing protein [Anaerolineae bacterium]|nr:SIS domain-containing protein [Anaerolineae bacterium]
MAIELDRDEYIGHLEKAAKLKDTAAELGIKFAKEGIKRVFLVGCGAPNREMGAIKYFLDRDIKSVEFYLYFPAELVHQAPAKLDEDSLVILASHSGTTPEILETAEFIKPYGCKVAAVTQFDDSPLAKAVPNTLCYGKSDHGYMAKFILLLAFLAGFVKEAEDWNLADKVLEDLELLPEILFDTAQLNDKRAIEEARLYHEDDYVMVLGAGPCYAAAYVTGVCVMMEMQWMHTFTGEAAEFFHGPFEVVLPDVPVMVYVGEDESRPIAERVIRFCKKFTERLIIYDSKDFEMKGVDKEVRPIFAPFVLEAATSRLMEHLAVWHNHPLSTRRYMWKFDY